MLKNKKIIVAAIICAVVIGGTGAGVALANHFSSNNGNSLILAQSKEAGDLVTAPTTDTTKVNNSSTNTKDTVNNDAESKSKDNSTNTQTSTKSNISNSVKQTQPVKKSTGTTKSTSSVKSSSSTKSEGSSKVSTKKTTGLKQKYLNELASVAKEEEQIYYDLKHPKENEPLTEGNAYSLWDDELNKVYGVVKNNISKSEFSKLEKSELAWIKDKDKRDLNITELANISKERCYYIVNNYMPE